MFTELEQHSWIKIDVARGRSTQECFQGLRGALGYTYPAILHDNARSHTAALSRTSCAAGRGRFLYFSNGLQYIL